MLKVIEAVKSVAQAYIAGDLGLAFNTSYVELRSKGYVKVEHGKVEVTPSNVQKIVPQTGKVTAFDRRHRLRHAGHQRHALQRRIGCFAQ